MLNHVSKMFVGKGVAFKAINSLAAGEIVAMDLTAQAAVTAETTQVIFALGTATLGRPVLSSPINVGRITSAVKNRYVAPVQKKMTLTVGAVPEAGKSIIVKVVYHDNLSIVPNQIKQTVIGVEASVGETTATMAAKIAAEFNKQEYIFVDVEVAGSVVTFTAKQLLTASSYNGIDRPESLIFEVGAPAATDGLGSYTVATTVEPELGQGSPEKTAWLADQHQGRRGYSDRRSWNDGKKFDPATNPNATYDTTVILATEAVEGDMQDTRINPVGAILALEEDGGLGVGTDVAFYTQLETAVSLTVIPKVTE